MSAQRFGSICFLHLSLLSVVFPKLSLSSEADFAPIMTPDGGLLAVTGGLMLVLSAWEIDRCGNDPGGTEDEKS